MNKYIDTIKQRIERKKAKDLSDQLILLYLSKDPGYTINKALEKAIKDILNVLKKEEELRNTQAKLKHDYKDACANLSMIPEALSHIAKLQKHVSEKKEMRRQTQQQAHQQTQNTTQQRPMPPPFQPHQ